MDTKLNNTSIGVKLKCLCEQIITFLNDFHVYVHLYEYLYEYVWKFIQTEMKKCVPLAFFSTDFTWFFITLIFFILFFRTQLVLTLENK